MRKIFGVILLLLLANSGVIKAEASYAKKDSIAYINCINKLKVYSSLPINELMIKTALYFKDATYIASTLEHNSEEQLVVNFSEFDCTTFVETCIALSLTLKSRNYLFSNYCNILQKLRYRDAKIEDYTSRLHYVSDWIYENSNILKDETQSLGGVLDTKKINFMSAHTDSYQSLKKDMNLQAKIRNIENNINGRNSRYILKKNEIAEKTNEIKDGNIIAFATSIAVLDYSHIGIAYHEKGHLTFIHASTRTMKVTIESSSLSDYCNNSKKCTGISVFRLID